MTTPSAEPVRHPNVGTCVVPMGRVITPQLSVEDAFTEHYAELRRLCQPDYVAGIAAVLVDASSGELHASHFLPHDPNAPTHLVIGRHSRCDLRAAAPQFSLRQGLLLLPPQSDQQLEYRFLELRSKAGTTDSRGRHLDAAEIIGPGFFRMAGSILLCMPTDVMKTLPSDAADAWQRLPPRQFQSRVHKEEAELLAPTGNHLSIVTHIAGISRAKSKLLDLNEVAIAQLILSHRGKTQIVDFGPKALQRGVAIGRYDRCDGGAFKELSLSRFHFLIVEVGNKLYGLDTASTAGTYLPHGEKQEWVLEMKHDTRLELGAVSLEWRLNTGKYS